MDTAEDVQRREIFLQEGSLSEAGPAKEPYGPAHCLSLPQPRQSPDLGLDPSIPDPQLPCPEMSRVGVQWCPHSSHLMDCG